MEEDFDNYERFKRHGLETYAFKQEEHTIHAQALQVENYKKQLAAGQPHGTGGIFFTRTRVIRVFESLWDWTDTAINGSSGMKERPSRSPYSTAWSGGSWRDAVSRALRGWPDASHMAHEFADEVRLEVEDEYDLVETPAFYHDMSGQFVDVGRFLANEPEAMMDMHVDEKSKPVIRIVINGSASYRVKDEAIIRRGAITVALIDLLEDIGMRCEVVMVVAVDSNRYFSGINGLQYFITIKEPGEHLMLDALMFHTANPGSLRRMAFSVMETEPEDIRNSMDITTWGGYGFPAPIVDYPHDIMVPALTMSNTEFNSDEGAKKWLVDIMFDQGLVFYKDNVEVTP